MQRDWCQSIGWLTSPCLFAHMPHESAAAREFMQCCTSTAPPSPLPPLLLAAAHHRVGSEMLTRLLKVLCKAEPRFRMMRGTQACILDAETSSSQPAAFAASDLAHLHRVRGLQLFSSGRWSIRPSLIAKEQAIPRWRMIHIVRPPFEVVASSYLYREYCRIRTRAPCCGLLTSVSSNLNSLRRPAHG